MTSVFVDHASAIYQLSARPVTHETATGSRNRRQKYDAISFWSVWQAVWQHLFHRRRRAFCSRTEFTALFYVIDGHERTSLTCWRVC